MSNRAVITTRTASLSSDFGLKMAQRYFDTETLETLGRYVRGKRKGLLRGEIEWDKVEKGGWVSTGPSTAYGAEGYVERRSGKVITVKLQTSPWGEKPVVIDTWIAKGWLEQNVDGVDVNEEHQIPYADYFLEDRYLYGTIKYFIEQEKVQTSYISGLKDAALESDDDEAVKKLKYCIAEARCKLDAMTAFLNEKAPNRNDWKL